MLVLENYSHIVASGTLESSVYKLGISSSAPIAQPKNAPKHPVYVQVKPFLKVLRPSFGDAKLHEKMTVK